MAQDELKNKVALITGANKGLGLEMSRLDTETKNFYAR